MNRVIGITGGIASGKSMVSSYLKELGFTVIDADAAARKVVEPGQNAYKQIISAFGSSILLSDGTIDRPLMGSIIFNDQEKRKTLNSIVHPAVRAWMIERKEEAFAAGEQTVFMDIPLLYESNLTHMVDAAVLVYVPYDIQLERLIKRNNFTKEEALSRINAQLPIEEKLALSDAVIHNEGTREQSKKQVRELLKKWGIIGEEKLQD
ncbi:dephospho-CoA kinase [Peribacillus deserti]|uniref:Dephospho-CoA kinase n=1 Tax=Peribacillus deserti TaxID=673318 RepID=A0ABS2QI87_9BACI|nr:dephospho-CoA kinase [Peribacillus deserti]MBM7692857.1 dephospho-CoA kinase [Peribacillus deserti]